VDIQRTTNQPASELGDTAGVMQQSDMAALGLWLMGLELGLGIE